MEKILTAVTIILVATSTSLICQPELDKARELIKQKKIGEAIKVCQIYLKSDQKDENAWLLLAQACLQAGKLDSAENAAQKVVELEDDMLEGYTVLAEVQLAKKNNKGAHATAYAGLGKIKKKQPRYPPLLVVLGQSLIELDSADAALIAASEAQVLDPQNATAFEVIGDSYAKQKVVPMAVNYYERSLELDSLQSRVLYKLANTYKEDRQYTEAARVYSQILAVDPKNDAARLELAELFFRAKLWRNCAKVMQEYIKSHKNPPEAVKLMFLEALFNAKLFKDAFQEGQNILKDDPKSPLANRVVATGYVEQKEYLKAIEAFKKLETLDTLRYDDYFWYGYSYEQLKKEDLAITKYEQAIQSDSTQSNVDIANVYDRIGKIYMNLRQYENAADNFQKRLELDSTAVGALINYALCMMQLEKYNNAVVALQKAIEQYPTYPPAYVNLGFCYFQMKKYDSGTEEFKKAIKIIDTAETKYQFELADSYRMLALAVMIEKKPTVEESRKKWEEAIVILKKSLKYNEKVSQTHQLIGQCYQNLNKIDNAIREYKRALQIDPKNKEANKYLQDLLKLQGL